MPIEVESPEELGYDTIRYNLGESSVRDLTVGELAHLDPLVLAGLAERVLSYGDHRGDPELRSLIAATSMTMGPADVLVTAGAAMALFIVHTAFLERGDEIVVFHPNYATNVETPRAIGARVLPLHLNFKNGYRPDPDHLESLISERTKIISITDPHNPTGVSLTADERDHIIRVAERHKCVLLVDETYRDLNRTELLPWAAEEYERAISVSSLSKSFGLPGIRVGWAFTRNGEFQERMLAAKEQMTICGSVLDEAVAVLALRQRDDLLGWWRAVAERHLAIVGEWMTDHRYLEWIPPTGGVVCFPRVHDPFAFDMAMFHAHLRKVGRTLVGPGHWFEVDPRSFRLGFGWPTEAELRGGLAAIDNSLTAARRSEPHR